MTSPISTNCHRAVFYRVFSHSVPQPGASSATLVSYPSRPPATVRMLSLIREILKENPADVYSANALPPGWVSMLLHSIALCSTVALRPLKALQTRCWQAVGRIHHLGSLRNECGSTFWGIISNEYGRKFGSQTSDLWTDEATVARRARKEKKSRRGKIRKERVRIKKISAKKTSHAGKHCVFPMFCGSGWSKSRLAKATGPYEKFKIARHCGAKHMSKSKC